MIVVVELMTVKLIDFVLDIMVEVPMMMVVILDLAVVDVTHTPE